MRGEILEMRGDTQLSSSGVSLALYLGLRAVMVEKQFFGQPEDLEKMSKSNMIVLLKAAVHNVCPSID